MRIEKGQLELDTDLLSWRRVFLDAGISEVPVDGEIAARAGLLPLHHGDPADRLIVATALSGHQLVTADRRILDWSGNLHRQDATE